MTPHPAPRPLPPHLTRSGELVTSPVVVALLEARALAAKLVGEPRHPRAGDAR